MRKIVVVILLLANILLSNAVFLKKASQPTYTVFNQLKDIENKQFGQKILDTIALQLKNKSPLSDIARMLAEIREDLVTQQATSDQLHASQEAECEEEIAEYNRRITVAIETRDSATQEISLLKGAIVQLKGEIKNKEIQLTILNTREVELQNARATDAADFTRRQSQSVEVNEALDLIIEKLSSIEPNSNPMTVMSELNKIGGNNPIMALVQVASTFSKESLDNVLQKLRELQVSITAAAEDDKVNESAAIAEYQALLSEIDRTRNDVANTKADAETRLVQSEGALALQERILEEAVNELLQSQTDKATKEQVCEDWRIRFEKDKVDRSAEVNIVKQVESIIATKLETMKDYLKGRANNE